MSIVFFQNKFLKNTEIVVNISDQPIIDITKKGTVRGLCLKYFAANKQASGIDIKAIDTAKPITPNLFLVLIISLLRLVKALFFF